MNESSVAQPQTPQRPVGTGGFLNPESIIAEFDLAPDMKVADFGSGSGYFTLLIARTLANTGVVTAIDIIENTLETVRSKAAALGLSNVQTIRGDLEVVGASGLPDASQDMVLMANVLFQSEKHREVLQEAWRIMHSGSTAIIIDWKRGSGGFGPPDDMRLTKEDTIALATEAGFQQDREINAGDYHFGIIFKKP